tara:strand:+ start:1485 stop:1862 length:378 start_codon:yes stop_codon:yes gene_type:complete
MEINKEIIKVLWNSVIVYQDRCLNHPEIRKHIENDCECKCIHTDIEYFIMLYLIQALTKEEKGVKLIHNKLLDAGIDKKIINNFIYSFLKINLKTENGIWSWNEIEEFNIDIDKVKTSTTKYSFF